MTSDAQPFEQTLKQLTAASEQFRTKLLAEPDDEPGWLSVAALTAEDTPHLAEVLKRAVIHYKTEDKQAPAALWFGHYAFTVAAVPIACYLTAQRVPRLRPQDVWVRFEEDGDIGGLAWRNRSFTALANDPASAHPDCTVLDSRDALRAELRKQIIDHLTPLVTAVRARSSFGKPGMWALAADYTASAFTWVGGLWGDEAGGASEARLFSAPPSPLHRQRGFIRVEQSGLSYQMLERTSCCLYYKVEGGSYCSNCPHRPEAERVKLIKSWLAQRAAEA